jgi:hypothetical protein
LSVPTDKHPELGRTHPDIWRIGLRSWNIIHNLIRRKESYGIGISLERLHNSKNALQIRKVIRARRIRAIDALLRGIDIDNQIDTGGIEDASAQIVVGSRIDIVNAYGVNLSLCISLALG